VKLDFRLRLSLLFSGLALLALAVLYVHSSRAVRDFALQSAREGLRADVGLAADLIQESFRRPESQAQALAARLSGQLGCRVTILGLDGRVLGDSEAHPAAWLQFEHHEGRPELATAARGGYGESLRFSAILGQEVLYIATRVDLGREGAGLVRLGRPLGSIMGASEPALGRLRQGLLLAAGALIVLSLVASHVLTAPLRGLVALARRVARGELDTKVRPYGQDEFAQVGRALDDVAGRLERELGRLRAEKERLEAILSGMAEAVMVTDEHGRVMLVNDAFQRTFQLDEEATGKGAFELVRVPVFQERLEQVLRRGQGSAALEFEMQHPARLALAGSIVALPREGLPGGAVIVFHDITELKHLEQVRKDFIANISHELRTPLSSIRGYAETLAEGGLNDRQRAERFLNTIRRHAERLSNLLGDILSLSRIESGEALLRRREFDMVQAVVDILDQLKGRAEAKTISTSVSAGAEAVPVVASREFIDQVLINLVDNAIKYSPPGSKVEVRVNSDGGEVQVDVVDTGIGIPAEDLDRVFERFYRVAKDRSRKVEGTGLGLAIAKNIIAAHHGRIWVASEPGKGSTFSFVIPAV
jgi:two-component system phosphate regulon sensor histidine kinase PhoR